MAWFRKKPVNIEAWRNVNDGEPWPVWLGSQVARVAGGRIAIVTLEGTMVADPGDWIIKGVRGEIYPCKSEIFAETYEPADAGPQHEEG